jgi:hypothetical protein
VGKRQKQKARERQLRVEKMKDFLAGLPKVPDTLYYNSYDVGPTTNTIRKGSRYIQVTWKHGSFLLTRWTHYSGVGGTDKAYLRCGDTEKATGRALRWLLQGLT